MAAWLIERKKNCVRLRSDQKAAERHLLGVIRLIGILVLRQPFRLSAGAKFDAVFFSHSALSFGIGDERRFYFEIDTPFHAQIIGLLNFSALRRCRLHYSF